MSIVGFHVVEHQPTTLAQLVWRFPGARAWEGRLSVNTVVRGRWAVVRAPVVTSVLPDQGAGQ
ncbi:MAG: hypothetical protein ACRDSR_00475 [Pseudonocardiaceae bacterium]